MPFAAPQAARDMNLVTGPPNFQKHLSGPEHHSPDGSESRSKSHFCGSFLLCEVLMDPELRSILISLGMVIVVFAIVLGLHLVTKEM
jgi:hypothetical protein